MWRSGSLNTPDAELDEWCEKMGAPRDHRVAAAAAREINDTREAVATRVARASLFTKSGSCYADKDKAKDDKWNDGDEDKPAPPKAGTGGARLGRRRRHRRGALRLRGGRHREADERGEASSRS